jgi:hypothetical protein
MGFYGGLMGFNGFYGWMGFYGGSMGFNWVYGCLIGFNVILW